MTQQWIVVDLDGTLCEIGHRLSFAQAGQWDLFHQQCIHDDPNEQVALILQLLTANLKPIVALTGRNEQWRKTTIHWLRQHGLSLVFDELLMRPDGNFEPDHELKIAMLEEFFDSSEGGAISNVFLVLEDRDKVVQAMRDYGLTVWQVKEGDY